MKSIFLFFLNMLVVNSMRAQADASFAGTTKSVCAEVLGAGIGFSANFDSRFKGQNGLGFRAGLGFVPVTGITILTIPLGVNYITSKRSSHFEAEFTGTVFTSTNGKFNGDKISPVFLFPHVGYRYSKPSKSFLGRIYGGPMFFGGITLPFAGISLGYTL